MNELELYMFEGSKVRAMLMNSEPWFVGKDVAEILGYKNTKDALSKHVDDEDKRIIQRSQITTLENHLSKKDFPANFVSSEIPNRGLTAVNESGLYSLIFGSKLECAKRFKHWVTSEVLPAIRKHGAYLTDKKAYDITHDPNSLADLLLQAGEQLKQKELIIQEMKPKAEFADAVTASENSIMVGHLAKFLKQNGIDIGQNRLFEWLRDNGYLIKSGVRYNLPTQMAMNLELFEVDEKTRKDFYGRTVVNTTTKVTGKGQLYFVKKLLKEKVGK